MKSGEKMGFEGGLAAKQWQNKGRALSPELKIKIDDLKSKLESGEITNEQFREEMMQLMPEKFHLKRGVKGHPKGAIPKELKAEFESLKTKLESGDITPEAFREEMMKLKPEKLQFKEGVKWQVKKGVLPEELKAVLDNLKNKLENGDITPEQFREEMMKLKQERLPNRKTR